MPKALGALGKILSHLLETAFSGSKCLVRKALIYRVFGQTKKRSSKKGGLRHFLWGKKKGFQRPFENGLRKDTQQKTSFGKYVMN